jgi:SAM-dependent methyltransferase
MPINRYLDEELNRKRILEQGHRNVVGGMWDLIGPMQRDFLVAHGLKPDQTVLDIGCGSLRGGLPITTYLNPGGYYGIDVSQALIEAGYSGEILASGLEARLPRHHLHVTDDFEIPFNRTFDFALSVSLFTHLTLDYLTRCLVRLAPHMDEGGQFFATVFEGDPDLASIDWPNGITTFPDRDPFHVSQAQIQRAVPESDWAFRWLGDWGHPRGQQMAVFIRR